MFASLLPGLRDLRTPLVTGYLWLLAFWLLLNQRIPTKVAQAHAQVKATYQLSSLLGQAVILVALSFVAYLLGSIVIWREDLKIVRPVERRDLFSVTRSRLLSNTRGEHLISQLTIFMATWLRDNAMVLKLEDHKRILGWEIVETAMRSPAAEAIEDDPDARVGVALANPYAEAIAANLSPVGIQLQAANRDLWDTYDRHLAAARFRRSIVPPMVVIFTFLAIESEQWWWLLLLAIPVALFFNARQHSSEAAATVVQAIVLKMVDPPLLQLLRDAVAKKREYRENGQQEQHVSDEYRGPYRKRSLLRP